ncbi:MAG: fumarate hydratase [Clostridia bacterium]|nr:fumarate hydratase [Clostridia bacterium]
MRIINSEEITQAVEKLCIDANYYLPGDIREAINKAYEKEESEVAKQILTDIIENYKIAENENVPVCQDTGMAVFFVKIGNNVAIEGKNITDAINEGVHNGYINGYLRCSVVKDPLDRVNTKDNTPAVIHYEFTDGENIEITIAPKGFGSENMSAIKMLKPSDGVEGVKKFVVETVKKASSNPCPPIVVGVGIGGSFEKCAILAKKALSREITSSHNDEYYKNLENELLEEINSLGIGPSGLGGKTTALGVNIETYPTHIAGLPVAVNISCHVTRHKTVIL